MITVGACISGGVCLSMMVKGGSGGQVSGETEINSVLQCFLNIHATVSLTHTCLHVSLLRDHSGCRLRH